MGAYLLITFDGDSMEALEPTIERAATLLLEEAPWMFWWRTPPKS